MGVVRTIFKDIAPAEMGVTYSHEHLICRPSFWLERKDDDLILDDIEKTLKDIIEFKELGGKTIVDATAIDYGRDINAVAEIARRADIHLIATAGFNKSFLWSAKLTEELKKVVGNYNTYYDWISDKTIDQLADHVISEVNQGLEGTAYKAGQVKAGTGYNSISPLEEKTIIAVCAAQKETKAPMHLHTEAGTMALEQLEILKREGVDPKNVSFGHMDRNLDLYYFEKILAEGSNLCFDSMGKIKYAPESARIEMIINLCKLGHENQILISHDLARKSYYKNYNYGIGMRFILDKWMPRFIEETDNAGLNGKKLMDKFLIHNPAKAFEFKD